MSRFGANFGQLLNLIANISGTEPNIVEQKMVLQTEICMTSSASVSSVVTALYKFYYCYYYYYYYYFAISHFAVSHFLEV